MLALSPDMDQFIEDCELTQEIDEVFREAAKLRYTSSSTKPSMQKQEGDSE